MSVFVLGEGCRGSWNNTPLQNNKKAKMHSVMELAFGFTWPGRDGGYLTVKLGEKQWLHWEASLAVLQMSITESQQSLTSPHCYYWSSHSLCPLHPHKQPLMLAFSFMISLGLIQSSSHTELLQNRRCWCWGAAVLFNPNSAWAQTNQAEGIKGGGGDQYSSMLPPHAKPKSLKENIDRRARKRCVCGPPSNLS